LPACSMGNGMDLRGILKPSQYPNFSAEEWLDEGNRLKAENRHQDAIEAFDLAIQKNCQYAEAYFARGACQYVLGNYRQAADDIDAAAILGCRDAQFWSNFDTIPYHTRLKDEAD